jgi:hypothetical protein
MDVVAAVVHGDPQRRFVFLTAAGQAGAVHDLPGDPHPRAVPQVRVTGRGPDLAMRHRRGLGTVTRQ